MKLFTPNNYKLVIIFALSFYYSSLLRIFYGIYYGMYAENKAPSFYCFVFILLACMFFLFSMRIEHWLLTKPAYFEQYANEKVKQIEEQVRLVSGNPKAVLSDEDRARIRLEAKPDRKTAKNYAKLFPLIAAFPLALTDWLLKNVGGSPYFLGIPLTVLLLAAIAPFMLHSIGSYIVLNSDDDKPLVGEIYKGYLEHNSDEVGSDVR